MDKAQTRFKERVREITARNRGHKTADVINELRLYVNGWINYFGISHSYKVWVRRRVRLYYWKQWSRNEVETACPQDSPKGAAKRRQAGPHAEAKFD